MKERYFFLIALFTSFSIFSQKNFIEGTIQNLQGETIRGLIDYKNWKENPIQISYKENETSPIIIYHPKNLHSFKVLNDIYVSKNITIDKTSRRTQSLSSQFDEKFENKTVFLKLLFESNKTLYYFVDDDGKKHFYIETQNEIEELIYKVALINSRRVEKKTYRNQLFKYFDDCSEVKDRIINLRYYKDEFLDLFKEYSLCVNEKSKYEEKKEKTIFKLYAQIGFVNSITEISTSNLSFSNPPIDVKNNSKNFAFGGAFEMVLPRNRRKNSIFNEVLYYNNNFSAASFFSFRPNQEETNTFIFSHSYITISNAYRYNFPSEKVKPFISLGVINSIPLKSELIRTTETRFFDTERLRMSTLDTYSNHEFGFLFGAGIKINKFALEAKFETGGREIQLTDAIDVRLKKQNLFLVASYNFL